MDMPNSRFFRTRDNLKVPRFFYGTAWKEGRTEELSRLAVEAGFLAIDTANQRKHYYEEGVGKALMQILQSGTKKREDLFIQTKFTFAAGQDHRKPYDEKAPYRTQVQQSYEKSLIHLGLDSIDSYILHGPFTGYGLTPEDWEAWGAIEDLYSKGKVKSIGVSNFNLPQLQELHEKARIKPHFIQNRCFAAWEWDRDIREFCSKNSICYQGFSLLTANLKELSGPKILIIAQRHKKTIPQIVFRFCFQMNMIVLTGTTNLEHMKSDLEIDSFELNSEELLAIERGL